MAAVAIRKVILPKPHKMQAAVLLFQARFKVLVAGRRWGKTFLGLIACIYGHGSGPTRFKGAVEGARIWWIAPTYPQATVIWRELKRALRGAWTDKSELDRRIELPGGGSISVKSGDAPDSMRGEGLDGAVLDEAALMAEEVWIEVLRPALADRKGWAIFISTPNREAALKGKNNAWFRRLFEFSKKMMGSGPAYGAWQRPSNDNPIMDEEEMEAARASMSALAYRQEMLAEFVVEGGGHFHDFKYYEITDYGSNPVPDMKGQHVDGALVMTIKPSIVITRPDGKGGVVRVRLDECQRFATMDLAIEAKQQADYTVIAVWAMDGQKNLYLLDVIRVQVEAADHMGMVKQVFDKWHPGRILIESNQYQKSLVQMLIRAGYSATPVKSDKDKLSRAQPIIVAYENGKVFHPLVAKWLNDWEDELQKFIGVNDEHDDQVDTASLAGYYLSLGNEPRIRLLG